MVVHGPPAAVAVSIVKAFAAAASQLRTTLQIGWAVPGATVIDCGSTPCTLSQREPVLPSTARAAVLPPRTLEAVAVLPCATLVVPHAGVGVGGGGRSEE